MDTASSTAAWATSYGAVGWHCFPLVPGGKRPLYRGWQRAAATERGVLEHMFRDVARNVGIVTGVTFDVFDIEAAHLPALAASMRANGHSLPLTPVAVTGRGGLHVFTALTGAAGTRRLYLDGVHVGELKSAGGFIVAAPSVTERQYAWKFAPAGMAVAAAPDWLLALVAPKPAFADRPVRRAQNVTEAQQRLEALAQYVARSGEGERNEVLFWAACRALEEGSSPRAVAGALTEAARDCGLVRDDGVKAVEATIASAVERVG